MYDFTHLFPCVLQVSTSAPSFCNYHSNVTDCEASNSPYLLLGFNAPSCVLVFSRSLVLTLFNVFVS